MTVSAGTRLGPYEIVEPLGAGGMGEVYRARDTKLDRAVAIKILPESFAQDPERLARFEREAKTLAALNHPNIAIVHGFEETNAIQALVMELVEGPTLADRITQGPVPLDEALGVARQIADALEAAHDRGIIHRDLKPANIKLRPDGTVKVLDFGLAKVLTGDASSTVATPLSHSPTITSPAMVTGVGIILGTAAYMSPEQAKGRPADKRSDVWAFGCVLYEMLTAERAFKGDDVSDTLAAVLRGEPDWRTLPTQTPASIRRLLRRCLEKDRKRRLSDAADARLEIDDAPDGRYVVLRESELGSSYISIVDLGSDGGRRALPVRAGESKPLVKTEFEESHAEISPDGRWLVYQSNRSGTFEVYVQPFPDVANGLWRVSTTGGTEPVWARDGELFYRAPNGAVMGVSFTSGSTWKASAPRQLFPAASYTLASPTAGGAVPRTYDVSPDGRRFLMMKNSDARPQTSTAPRIIVVQNWFTELHQRVPTR